MVTKIWSHMCLSLGPDFTSNLLLAIGQSSNFSELCFLICEKAVVEPKVTRIKEIMYVKHLVQCLAHSEN